MKVISYLHILFLLLGIQAMAQSSAYVFRHIVTSDGLASNSVRGIFQDARGFLWISTLNGLQRYDGYDYLTYHHDPLDTSSISSDGSICLLEDRDRNIWLSSWPYGFTVLNPVTGKCKKIFDPSLSDAEGACLDKRGNVWLIASSSLEQFDYRSKSLISYKKLLPDDISLTSTMLYDPRSDDLYMNSVKYGICLFDLARKQFYYCLRNPLHIPLLDLHESAATLFLDKQNKLWFNTFSGKLLSCSLDSGQLKRYFMPDLESGRDGQDKITVSCIMQNRSGTMWFGAGKTGVFYYSKDDGLLKSIPLNRGDGHGFNPQGGIRCLLEDNEENIWAGTDEGIYIFNPGRQRFISVPIPSLRSDPPIYSILSFLERKNGDIWVATYGGGIFVFDQFLHFKNHYSADRAHPTNRHRLPHEAVWSMLERPDGRVIIGSQHGWLSIYDPDTQTFDNSQPPGLKKWTISRLDWGKERAIWMAVYHGVGKWDIQKNHFTTDSAFIPYHGTSETISMDMLADIDSNLWVATIDHGLQKFNVGAGRFEEADTPSDIHQGGMSSAALQSVINLDDKLMALGTHDAGIDIFNRLTRHNAYITTLDGLPTNDVSALWYGPSHCLWAATEQGLCKINLLTKHTSNYGLEDGIAGTDFSDMLRFYRLRSGRVLAGYKGGFVCFDPDSSSAAEPPKDVTITGIRVFEKPLSLDSVMRGDTARFSYLQNFISIQYASLNFAARSRTKYFYKLEGVDKDWVSAGARRFASYTNLPGGKYIFMVRCENTDRIPCRNTTSFTILIDPPFWRTNWFYFLAGIAVLGLLYGIYRYRVAQILQLQAVRNKISRDIHDDVGATLTSIVILSEIAKNKMDQGNEPQSYSLLDKISAHARDTVEKMSDIIWSIKPSNDNIENIIRRLKHFALETCSARQIELNFTAHEKVRKLTLPMELTKNAYLICKEGINNAIKHAKCSRISVVFSSSRSALEMLISDDGIGIDPGSENNGNGLVNMDARAKEIKGSMLLRSGDAGTRVSVRLPIP